MINPALECGIIAGVVAGVIVSLYVLLRDTLIKR